MSAVDYEDAPFPPGESPFRVKGTAYRGHCDYTDEHVPGGMFAAIRALNDPRLKAFFTQPFLASNFYDLYPLISMGFVCARLVGTTFPDFLRTRTRHQVASDLGGVYKAVLRMASAESIARKIPMLTSQYFNFAPCEVLSSTSNSVSVAFKGMPATIAPWYAPIVETYVVRGLELNKTKNPKSRLYPFKKDGQVHGVDAGVLKIDWSWE